MELVSTTIVCVAERMSRKSETSGGSERDGFWDFRRAIFADDRVRDKNLPREPEDAELLR